jgi:hypothetical protein
MKFPQLPSGARFHWRGNLFTKVGPLTARSDADESVSMIPRSATVTLVDDDQSSPRPTDGNIDPASLRAALSHCIEEVSAQCAGLPQAERDTLERTLASAHRHLLGRLGL